MSSTDKFVLLPYERYERLIKIGNKNPHSLEGTRSQEDNPQDNKTIPEAEEREKDTDIKEVEKKQPKSPKSIQEQELSKRGEKIRPLPPGIRNKPKINSFKWHSLF